MVLALGALGFGLIYFTTRHFHIAHGAVYTLGAYTAYYSIVQLHFNTALAGVIVLAVTAFCGFVLEKFIYGPLVQRRAAGEVVLLSSLGVYVVVANTVAAQAGDENVILRGGVEQTVTVMSATLTSVQLLQAVSGLLGIIVLGIVLRFSRVGRRFRAVAESPDLSLVLGVDVQRVRLQVLIAGSVLSGLSGFLSALDTGADPHVGFPAFLNASICCLFAGTASFLAPAAGALLLGLLQGLAVWWFGAQWRSAAVFSLLAVLLLIGGRRIGGIRKAIAGE
jgi:branched-chain amino acid transport system permease protein